MITEYVLIVSYIIGTEKDENYFNIAKERILNEKSDHPYSK